jgi:hypothetical protein
MHSQYIDLDYFKAIVSSLFGCLIGVFCELYGVIRKINRCALGVDLL